MNASAAADAAATPRIDFHRVPCRAGGPVAWELRVPPFRVFYDVDEA